jgi:hypothetical protein
MAQINKQFEVVVKALDQANRSGAFNLSDAAIITANLEGVAKFIKEHDKPEPTEVDLKHED